MRAATTIQSALAALLAACVVLLGIAAHAPALHDTLCRLDAAPHCATADGADDHGHAHDDDAPAPSLGSDHACAITLFAAGCEAPALPFLLAEPALNATRVAHFTEFMLARTLRGPARVCGPPALA